MDQNQKRQQEWGYSAKDSGKPDIVTHLQKENIMPKSTNKY